MNQPQPLTTSLLYHQYVDNLQRQNQHITSILAHLSTTEQTLGGLLRSSRDSDLEIMSTLRSSINNSATPPQTQPSVRPIRRTHREQSRPARWVNHFRAPDLSQFLEETHPVFPTQDQLTRATRIDFFRNIENPINSICPITQQPFNLGDIVLQIVHCGHNFTLDSAQQWFRQNVRCPICRHDVRETSYRRELHNIPNDDNNNTNDDATVPNNLDSQPDDTSRHTDTTVPTNPSSSQNISPIDSSVNVLRVTRPQSDLPTPPPLEQTSGNSSPTLPVTRRPSQTPEPVITESQDTPSDTHPNLHRDIERNILASLADSLNDELRRAYNQPETDAGATENTGENTVSNPTIQRGEDGSIIYSFSYQHLL